MEVRSLALILVSFTLINAVQFTGLQYVTTSPYPKSNHKEAFLASYNLTMVIWQASESDCFCGTCTYGRIFKVSNATFTPIAAQFMVNSNPWAPNFPVGIVALDNGFLVSTAGSFLGITTTYARVYSVDGSCTNGKILLHIHVSSLHY